MSSAAVVIGALRVNAGGMFQFVHLANCYLGKFLTANEHTTAKRAGMQSLRSDGYILREI